MSDVEKIQPGHWDTADGAMMAQRYASLERKALIKGDMSDFYLANAQYLATRTDLDLEAYQSAAKDRIRWLSVQLAIARNQLASQAASLAPFAFYNGDLPEDDHPLRCVFESGIQYAVNLLAKELGVADWTPCDGTEEFDGDLGGTLMNIVCASLPEDEDGERMFPRDIHARLLELSATVVRITLDNAIATVAAHVMRKAFRTSVSGMGRYSLNSQYRSMEDMHQADEAIRAFINSPRFMTMDERAALAAGGAA